MHAEGRGFGIPFLSLYKMARYKGDLASHFYLCIKWSYTIYSIACNDCNQEYIGETKRQFGTRLKEYQKTVAVSKKDNSALSEHTYQTNHTIAWDNSKIITTNHSHWRERAVKLYSKQ